jgi:hypothetical protein
MKFSALYSMALVLLVHASSGYAGTVPRTIDSREVSSALDSTEEGESGAFVKYYRLTEEKSQKTDDDCLTFGCDDNYYSLKGTRTPPIDDVAKSCASKQRQIEETFYAKNNEAPTKYVSSLTNLDLTAEAGLVTYDPMIFDARGVKTIGGKTDKDFFEGWKAQYLGKSMVPIAYIDKKGACFVTSGAELEAQLEHALLSSIAAKQESLARMVEAVASKERTGEMSSSSALGVTKAFKSDTQSVDTFIDKKVDGQVVTAGSLK